MSVKGRVPIEIFPQRCYACGKELKEGDKAIASVTMPLAFCTSCRGEKTHAGGDYVNAVVKGESSG